MWFPADFGIGRGGMHMQKAKVPIVIIIGILAGTAIVTLVATPGAESSDASGIGRYQLVAGCYESTVGEGIIHKDDSTVLRGGVFRIDTATGDTWVLTEHIDTSSVVEDKYDREWVLID
jgi:hypothetical protein